MASSSQQRRMSIPLMNYIFNLYSDTYEVKYIMHFILYKLPKKERKRERERERGNRVIFLIYMVILNKCPIKFSCFGNAICFRIMNTNQFL